MSDYKVLIIGYGTVGQNLHKELSALNPIIYDKYKESYTKRPCDYVLRDGTLVYSPVAYDIAFICVDTPLDQNDRLDITEVRNAINENLAGIYVIKSTCPVGTTDLLMTETGKKIVYSPEYYGGLNIAITLSSTSLSLEDSPHIVVWCNRSFRIAMMLDILST